MGDGLGRRLFFVSDLLYLVAKYDGVLDVLRISMSAGETYCVPEIHWMLVMVGRWGVMASGL
jgi:hypothetical protein